jgi:ribonuclease-3
MQQPDYKRIETIIDYTFENKDLLREAFTHPSFANINNLDYHYERLEFLGDSVLGLVISEYVFKKFKLESEGTLTHLKSYMVNSDSLATITEKNGLHKFLLVPVNEKDIHKKKKIKENLFEAIVGAVYLDGGLDNAKKFILNSMKKANILVNDISSLVFDPKTTLQELLQKEGISLPEYLIISRKGPVHDTVFVAELRINNKRLATGEGKSKKEAHQQCAKKVLEQISANGNWKNGFEN